MSVPLDRLYHYLADIVNHDLIIYRWAPHGSRKLEDLNQLTIYFGRQTVTDAPMICHDQEPLIWNYYTREQIKTQTKNNYLNQNSATRIEGYNPDWLTDDAVLEYTADQYLRSLTACINQYDLTLLLHSEQNSANVEVFAKHGFVPVYYWSHAVISQDWFRYAEHDPSLGFSWHKIKKDFLIYNRAWSGTREYRLFFTELLCNHGLQTCANTSFSITDNQVDYRNHAFVNNNLRITSVDLHTYLPSNTTDSSYSADYNSTDYSESAIEIVLETVFDDQRWHLTEKTLRPIACGKPFILAATPGSLQYLRNYGFETFSDYINESYDSITEPHLRLQAIVKEMQRISQLDTSTKQQLMIDLDRICQHNRQHFFNKFFDQVIQEYKTNLDHAMTIMDQNRTGKHLRKIHEILLKK